MKKLKSLLSVLVYACLAILLVPSSVFATETDAVKVSTEEQLRTALEAGQSVVLENDITIKNTSSNTTTTSRTVGIVIEKDPNASTSTITIDGAGFTIKNMTTAASAAESGTTAIDVIFEVYSGDVVFKNVEILNVKDSNSLGRSRCIDTRKKDLSIKLENATLTTTGSSNTQALTIGGNTEGEMIDVTLIESTITTLDAGYGIITFNPVNLIIDSTSITGYAALYMKEDAASGGSEGSIVKIQNGSNLTSENIHEGESNVFGTIILDDGNIKVEVTDSTVAAKAEGLSQQVVFGENPTDKTSTEANTIEVSNSNITVELSDESIAAGNVPTLVSFKKDETDETAPVSEIVVKGGVTSNVAIPEEYIEEGYKLQLTKMVIQ